MDIETLIEDYERRKKTIRTMIWAEKDEKSRERLIIKSGMINAFLVELKQLKQDSDD